MTEVSRSKEEGDNASTPSKNKIPFCARSKKPFWDFADAEDFDTPRSCLRNTPGSFERVWQETLIKGAFFLRISFSRANW